MAGGNLYTKEEDATILRVYAEHNGKRGWSGVAHQAIPHRCATSIIARQRVLASSAVERGEETVHSAFASAPLSLDDVIRLWRIDTNVWEAQTFQPNKWEIGAKHPVSGEILTKPLYQTKVLFRRRKAATAEIIAKQLLADIAVLSKARTSAKSVRCTASPQASDVLAEFDLFDIHLGKYSWGAETGEPYDTGIAEQIVKAALSDLLGQCAGNRVSQICLPIGNDFYHVDTLSGTTTAGTPVDHDTRFQRMFRCGHLLASWMISECAKVAPVHVPIVPGNHDATVAFTMGVVLEAEFRHDNRVTFDNSPKPRKYYRYGKTLLGFTHGDKEKPQQLPQLMPVECPQDWAASTCREFHIGHFHHGKQNQPITVDDQTGVTVRWMRSLSAADSWHNSKGFVGNQRSGEAFLWHRDGGMRAHFVSLPIERLVKP